MAKKSKQFSQADMTQRLISAGFNNEQTESLIELVIDLHVNNQITSHDLKELYSKIVLSMGAMMVTSTGLTIGLLTEIIT